MKESRYFEVRVHYTAGGWDESVVLANNDVDARDLAIKIAEEGWDTELWDGAEFGVDFCEIEFKGTIHG